MQFFKAFIVPEIFLGVGPTYLFCFFGDGGPGGVGGLTNERPGTDHVISGPMRGLEKNCIRWLKHTNRQTDIPHTGDTDSLSMCG